MVQVGEFQRVSQEKYRGVIAYKIPVAAVGIELYGKSPYVAFGIGGTPFSRHSGEPNQTRGLFTYFRKNGCAGEFGNIVGDGECAECSGAFGVRSELFFRDTTDLEP